MAIRDTKEGEEIEIDTYEDARHMMNICKIIGKYDISDTIESMRHNINDYINMRASYYEEEYHSYIDHIQSEFMDN